MVSATSSPAVMLTVDMTPQQAMALVVSGKVSTEAYLEWDADRIKRIVSRTKSAASAQELRCKVSDKGALSVYGLNAKWPVTLYAGQWERLLGFSDTIKAFIAANKDTLARKS